MRSAVRKKEEEEQTMKIRHLLISFVLGLGLALTLLWLTSGSVGGSARAAPSAGLVRAPADELHVCGTCVYTNVQAAVDAADLGDVIKVAAGTYTDIHQRNGITQVAYISKSVTIRGGYTTTNGFADPPDPAANPTTLDAQELGRVLVVSGTITPVLEGLRITGGNGTGLGGRPVGDAGGGVYVYMAAATISDCVATSNTVSTADWGFGGGLYLESSAATLTGNTVTLNTASTISDGFGGGVYLFNSDGATLSGNTVASNTASAAAPGYGGGLNLTWSAATLNGNTVQGNTASKGAPGYGGGVYITGSKAFTLSGNTLQGNKASTVSDGYGGGLDIALCVATLRGRIIVGNTVVSNTATLSPTAIGQGGGLRVYSSNRFTLTNNLVADNHANTEGSGLWFAAHWPSSTAGRLLHTTIADNRGSGQGVFVGECTTLFFTNAIIAGHHSVGITNTTPASSTVIANYTLFSGNGTDYGSGVNSGNEVSGTPAFVNPSAWDYHLTSSSAAVDRGVNAGVTTDIDGDARPIGPLPDIGADEAWRWIYLPLALRNHG
jgi:parallel beta-helix repeat protein